jgi:hypothetical protein
VLVSVALLVAQQLPLKPNVTLADPASIFLQPMASPITASLTAYVNLPDRLKRLTSGSSLMC